MDVFPKSLFCQSFLQRISLCLLLILSSVAFLPNFAAALTKVSKPSRECRRAKSSLTSINRSIRSSQRALNSKSKKTRDKAATKLIQLQKSLSLTQNRVNQLCNNNEVVTTPGSTPGSPSGSTPGSTTGTTNTPVVPGTPTTPPPPLPPSPSVPPSASFSSDQVRTLNVAPEQNGRREVCWDFLSRNFYLCEEINKTPISYCTSTHRFVAEDGLGVIGVCDRGLVNVDGNSWFYSEYYYSTRAARDLHASKKHSTAEIVYSGEPSSGEFYQLNFRVLAGIYRADEGRDFSNNVGIYHMAGTDGKGLRPLDAGLNVVSSVGSKIARIAVSPDFHQKYGGANVCNLDLSNIFWTKKINELIRAGGFKKLMITAYDQASFSNCATKNYLNGSFFSAENYQKVKKEYYDFTWLLLSTLQDLDLTVYISNWETDNDLYQGSVYAASQNPAAWQNSSALNSAIAGLKSWFRARQEGIQEARANFGNVNLKIVHAPEIVSAFLAQRAGLPSVLDNVLTQVNVDAVSYSSWETLAANGPRVSESIARIRSVLNKPVIVGEFGFLQTPLSNQPEQVLLRALRFAEESRAAGAEFSVYWQAFDNAAVNGDDGSWGIMGRDGSARRVAEMFSREGLPGNFQSSEKQGVYAAY
jgi:hypothetical protein